MINMVLFIKESDWYLLLYMIEYIIVSSIKRNRLCPLEIGLYVGMFEFTSLPFLLFITEWPILLF